MRVEPSSGMGSRMMRSHMMPTEGHAWLREQVPCLLPRLTSRLPTVLRPDRLSSRVVFPEPEGLHRTRGAGQAGDPHVSGALWGGGGTLHHQQQGSCES